MGLDLFRFLFVVFIGLFAFWIFLVSTNRPHVVLGFIKNVFLHSFIKMHELFLWRRRRLIRKIKDVFYLVRTEDNLSLWAEAVYIPFRRNRSLRSLRSEVGLHCIEEHFRDLDKMLEKNIQGQWDLGPANAALFPDGNFKLELKGAVALETDVEKGVYRIGMTAALFKNVGGKLRPFGFVVFSSSKFGSTRAAAWFDKRPAVLFKRLSELRTNAETKKSGLRHLGQKYFPKRKRSIAVPFGTHRVETRVAEYEFYYDVVSPCTGVIQTHLNFPYRFRQAKKDPDSILSVPFSKCHSVSSVRYWLLPVSRDVKEACVIGKLSKDSMLKKEVTRVTGKNKKAISKLMSDASSSKEKMVQWNALLTAHGDLHRGTEGKGPASELPLNDSTVLEWARRKVIRMCAEENTRGVIEDALKEGALLEIVRFQQKDNRTDVLVRVNCALQHLVKL